MRKHEGDILTVGSRIREERKRLGLSQPRLAAIAGVAKNTAINWEKDLSSPTATALIAFADAGADALYILTGRRTENRQENATTQIEEELASIRRKLLEPTRRRLPGESDEDAEKRVIGRCVNALHAMLRHDQQFMPSDLAVEVEHLYDIATNNASLALYRAADFAQMRAKRREKRAALDEWLTGGPYSPSDQVRDILTTLAMEYAVPEKLIGELFAEIDDDLLIRNRFSSDAESTTIGDGESE